MTILAKLAKSRFKFVKLVNFAIQNFGMAVLSVLSVLEKNLH